MPRSQTCAFIPHAAGEYFWEVRRSAMQGSGRGKRSVHRMKKIPIHDSHARAATRALSAAAAHLPTRCSLRKSDEVKALRDGSRGEPITHRAISFVEANIVEQERDASGLVPRLGEFSRRQPATNAIFSYFPLPLR